jgi:hypothetical protein
MGTGLRTIHQLRPTKRDREFKILKDRSAFSIGAMDLEGFHAALFVAYSTGSDESRR